MRLKGCTDGKLEPEVKTGLLHKFLERIAQRPCGDLEALLGERVRRFNRIGTSLLGESESHQTRDGREGQESVRVSHMVFDNNSGLRYLSLRIILNLPSLHMPSRKRK